MARKSNPLVVAARSIDPTLNALFASSAGPVRGPPALRRAAADENKSQPSNVRVDEDIDGQDDDEVLSEISEELDYGDDDDEEDNGDNASSASEDDDDSEDAMSVSKKSADEEETSTKSVVVRTIPEVKPKAERKRKRKDENEDLEGKYLAKLVQDDESEPSGKRQKGQANVEEDKNEDGDDGDDDGDKAPLHETMTEDNAKSDLEKASRTVFLANVSTDAIASKSAKKELLKHLSSVLEADASPPQKIESLRFRSVAFSAGALPKRAAYITKALMESTTKSTNAYAVYSSAALARKAAKELNGTEVLGRHIRVDSVAHPSPTDHRRCVFVGNLGFVDDETVLNTKADGETVEKKRNKVPSDIEEGLWRTFGTQGKVENVRVVRDAKTRVGKGFAYVQFYDGNDVEAALLLNEKKFPPMLPRALRVTRAKDPRKTAQVMERSKAKADAGNVPGRGANMKYRHKATPEEQAAAGRASKLLGRSGAFNQRKPGRKQWSSSSSKDVDAANGLKTPEHIVFEGRRASSKDGRPKDLKLGKKGKGKASKAGKPKTRSARRGATWKQKK